MTNSGQCSWYEFAKKIFEIAHIDCKIVPVKHKSKNPVPKRPGKSVLTNVRLEEQKFDPMRSWDAALLEYLEELNISPKNKNII